MSESIRFDRAFKPYRPEGATLDPRKVVIDPAWNVRDMNAPGTREHINNLKASILVRGVDDAIEVRFDPKTGITTLVDGQCRLTACRELWDEGHEVFVPSIRVKGDEAELTARSMTSNAGQPLTQWEIGAGCRRLLKYGWNVEQIAAHICKPKRYVTEAIALSEVSIGAKALMATGKVTPARVLQEVKDHGDAATQVLEEAVKEAEEDEQTNIQLAEEEEESQQSEDAEPTPTPAKKKSPKPKKVKPLARRKALSPTETSLEIADELANMIVDDEQSLDNVIALARKYLKSRSKQ